MPWLTKLKIALAEKKTQEIAKLIENLPQFKTEAELEEAQYLFKEAVLLVSSLKDETLEVMQQVQNNLNFLQSSQPKTSSKLDIKS